MEAVKFEEISIPTTPKRSLKALSKDIHPNLINGCIPINMPVFLDLFGESRSNKTFKFLLRGSITDIEVGCLYFISTSLQKAFEQNGGPLTYLYYIQFIESDDGVDVIVRGV